MWYVGNRGHIPGHALALPGDLTMLNLSNSNLQVTLPSGNKAVYSVQPQHMNDIPGVSLAERAMMYGEQLAHEHGGQWFKPGGWQEITDLRTIALLERCPEA